jgi:hypothetical protein
MHQARATSQGGKQGEGDHQYTVCPHGSESGAETKGDGSARQTQVRVEVLGVWVVQVSAKHTSVGAHGALALESFGKRQAAIANLRIWKRIRTTLCFSIENGAFTWRWVCSWASVCRCCFSSSLHACLSIYFL